MADQLTTIKPSGQGGDYTALETALAAKENDLVTVINGKWEFEIDGTWSSDDTTNVDIGGWTTDATRYVRIYTTATARHDGTSRSTNAYVLAPTGTSHCIVLNQEYTRIEGLEIILKDNPANSSEGIRCDAGSDDSTIDKCIIWHDASDTDADGIYLWNSSNHINGHTINIYNCFIYGFTRCGINMQCYVNNSDTTNMNVRNCTVWDCGSADVESACISARQEYSGQTVNLTVGNNICGDNPNVGGRTDFDDVGAQSASINWAGNNNVCTTAAGPMPGGASVASYTLTEDTAPAAGDWIIVANLPSTGGGYATVPDFHLADDADNDVLAIGASAQQPPSPYATDIDGDTRADPPDPGYDEVAGAAPAAFTARVTMF